ncbi:trypsin-like peptidase domain-containing protein [Candidatus Gracilibacteria bacterium]|nr:trypsin-like peptidase domain-containing protein [Candidatus Gracilibacteria bacterium]
MKIFGLSFLIICLGFLSGGLGSYIFLQDIYSPQNTINLSNSRSNIDSLSPTFDTLQNIEQGITGMAQALGPSVVSIIISRDMVMYRSDPWGFFQEPNTTVRRQVGGGSGFFIREDGLILTNKHVVQDSRSDYTVILADGREFETEVIALDPLNDLAVIRIQGGNESFPVPKIIHQGDDISIGSFAIAIGNALAEFQNSVSLGIVSGKDRSIEAGGTLLTNLIQTDAAINPGNSGGPLLNLNGEVIGINTAIAGRTNGIGFAIALTTGRVDYILKSIEEHGEIKRPFIGINYIANSPSVAREFGLALDYGAYIIDEPGSIINGSSADKAGLKPGDLITHINNEQIGVIQDLARILQNSLPGDSLTLRVMRGGENIDINLELGVY